VTSQRQVSSYGSAVLPFTDHLKEANAHWTASGLIGRINLPSLDFDLALSEMEAAKIGFETALKNAESVRPGSDVREAHGLLLQAIRKQARASMLAVNAIKEWNETAPQGVEAVGAVGGQKMHEAAFLYEEGINDSLAHAAKVIEATARIDKP
jgi:hypothetical protein